VNTFSFVFKNTRHYDLDGRYYGVSYGILWGNTLGTVVGMTLPFMAVLLITRRSTFKTIVLLFTFVISSWVVAASASRAGIICIAASLLLTWMLVLKEGAGKRLLGVLFVGGVLIILAFAPGVLRDRFRAMFDNGPPNSRAEESALQSQQDRASLLRNSIQYTFEHPLLGVGLGNFMVENGTRTQQSSGWLVTHNSYTEVSSEAGIPALVMYVVVMLVSLRRSWRISKREELSRETRSFASATSVSILIFMLGCTFASLSYGTCLYFFIAIAVGLAAEDSRTPIPNTRNALSRTVGAPRRTMPQTKRFAVLRNR
jgi:O-antigen ligase